MIERSIPQIALGFKPANHARVQEILQIPTALGQPHQADDRYLL